MPILNMYYNLVHIYISPKHESPVQLNAFLVQKALDQRRGFGTIIDGPESNVVDPKVAPTRTIGALLGLIWVTIGVDLGHY